MCNLAFFTILSATLFTFQNCSGFKSPASQQDLFSIDVPGANSNVDFFWDMAGKGPGKISVNRLQQIQRWADATDKSVVLFPPLLNPYMPDMESAPSILQTSTGPLISFGPNQRLFIQGADSLSFVSSEYTVGLYIREIDIPSSGNMRIFSLSPADNSQTGIIGLDICRLDHGLAQIRAYSYYDDHSYVNSSINLDIANLQGGFSIAMRFAKDPTQMRLSVNGSQGTISSNGATPFLGAVARTLALHALNFTEGRFLLAGFAIWKKELSNYQVDALDSSLKSYYEHGGTMSFPSPDTGIPSSGLKFSDVQSSFSTCMLCHSEIVSSRAALLSAKGITDTSTSWVVPGNASDSVMIKALRHEGGISPMPKSAAALSSEAIAKIADWINQGAN